MQFIYADYIGKPPFEHCLNEDELEFARTNTVSGGTPVVFLADGQPVDIVSGQKQPADTPQAERICYFNFSKETAAVIAKVTRTEPDFILEKKPVIFK